MSHIKQFDDGMRAVIQSLEHNQEDKARKQFDELLRPLFKDHNVRQKLKGLISYYYDLDDYLNNEAWRVIGATKREDLIGSYYSDYQESLKAALMKE